MHYFGIVDGGSVLSLLQCIIITFVMYIEKKISDGTNVGPICIYIYCLKKKECLMQIEERKFIEIETSAN